MYHSAGQVEMSGMKYTGKECRMSAKLNDVVGPIMLRAPVQSSRESY